MKLTVCNIFLKRLWGNKVFRHAIYWICGYTFLFLNVFIWEGFAEAYKIGLIIILPGVIPVYLHFFVHKRFFMPQRYLMYVLSVIIILVGAQFLGEAIIRVIEKDAESHTSGAGTAFFFIILTTTLHYYKKGITQQIRLQEAESRQLQTELALLKSQVNPHFFFNTLNNLYALSLDRSERVPEVILKISDLMRYVLDCSEDKKVELTQEIDFLQNYLSLQRLRLSADSDITFNVAGNLDGKVVAPMLLLPFIENSFKHGTSASTGDNYVHIDLKIEGSELLFSIENNRREKPQADMQSSPKSGLKNVIRRLELMYPDRHTLDIDEERMSYKVNLKIRL